ncbi:MAG: PLP-dependent aspartate aminotransferase family protein [Thermoanaerobaculaceae bacterium]|jgi:cystathionine beta-lyase|nr:PLP-dependent aspartate aminotransferase family protein [Thermoanaerobaculaceae bacterium]
MSKPADTDDPGTAGSRPDEPGFETLCTHFGEDRAASFGAAAPPIVQTSTFVYPTAEAFGQRGDPDTPFWDYTRVGNPTTALLEAKLARLERGEWALAFASGMGAITAALQGCLASGDHVVCVASCYAPTRWYLDEVLTRFGVGVTYVDSVDAEGFLAALQPRTRLVYLESPTSGVFHVLDVPALTAALAPRGVLTVLDNSWASPCFQNPLELGCDLVLHSATKYIGGHSDVVAGIVVGRDREIERRVRRQAELAGACLDPFAAWLLVRGLRTLALRMAQHQTSGLAVARMLAGHPGVLAVHHPGLDSHAGHELARRQLRGYAGLFSFALVDQSPEAARRFLNRLRLFSIGVSWGGHESLAIEMPRPAGSDGARLIRLHCGLETTSDLVADVREALL